MNSHSEYQVRSAPSATGYSLAELLVVLAIIALLLAVVPLGLARVLPGARLNADAQRFAAGLRALRTEAVERGAEAVLRIKGGKVTSEAGGRELDVGDAVAVRYLAPGPAGGLGEQTTFRFLPDGSSTGGVFVLSTDGRERRVTINWLFGHVQVSKAGGAQ